MPTFLRLALVLALGVSPAWAQTRPAASGGFTVQQPWARATAPHQTVGAVYFTLTSPRPDQLVSLSSPDADMAMLHSESMEGGVMRMREQPDGIAVAAGVPVRLAPGGEHVMLMGLHHPLVAGQSVVLHLAFRSGATVAVTVPVRPLGAPGPG